VTKTSIKEKLPLVNSDRKVTRIAGYVVYIFIGLFVLGAILPSPDTGGETATTAATPDTKAATTAATVEAEEEEEIDPNLEWLAAVLVSMGYLVEDMQTIQVAAEGMDIDGLAAGCSDLKNHVQVAKSLNVKYDVSSDLETARYEWSEALSDYGRAADAGYDGANDLDAELLEKSSLYMGMADKHLEKMTSELEKTGYWGQT